MNLNDVGIKLGLKLKSRDKKCRVWIRPFKREQMDDGGMKLKFSEVTLADRNCWNVAAGGNLIFEKSFQNQEVFVGFHWTWDRTDKSGPIIEITVPSWKVESLKRKFFGEPAVAVA